MSFAYLVVALESVKQRNAELKANTALGLPDVRTKDVRLAILGTSDIRRQRDAGPTIGPAFFDGGFGSLQMCLSCYERGVLLPGDG
ncbi:hypothetical protein D9M68_507090 [compost metagenome]